MSHAATWAIVPVKSLEQAKQRLARVLPLEARRRLMLTMLEDVLATLGRVELLRPVLVVTPDTEAAELAANAGASVLREASGQGHSAAAIAGFTYAQSHGAVRALTLPADAPLVTAAELHSLIQAGATPTGPHMTLVPSHDGDGTNGFLVSPPDLLQPSFGPGSFARHLAHAAARQIECRVRHLPGLALDIDEPADLARLIALKRGDRRYDFLGARQMAMERQ
jgi:2-phospho-L-lactate/phosphoenolpyruvate guanylyltransferase